MKLLNEQIIQQVRDIFDAQMKQPVEVLFFGSQDHCDTCEDTRQLAEEVIALSDKLHLSVYDLDEHADIARKYGVDKTPATIIAARDGEAITDYSIRLLGIPAGHEFTTLIQDIILVSSRDSGLGQPTREFLKTLEQPLHLQVFVTPTCPYCPRAVVLAHQMALESPLVTAEMVEATEFPDLADKFGVSGVPQTTINDGAGTLVGAAPEDYLVAEIVKALENDAVVAA